MPLAWIMSAYFFEWQIATSTAALTYESICKVLIYFIKVGEPGKFERRNTLFLQLCNEIDLIGAEGSGVGPTST